MHRYVVSGILDDMRAGKRVLVLGDGADAASLMFLTVAEQVLTVSDAHLFRVYRARGQQRVTIERPQSWRGEAWFHTIRSAAYFQGVVVNVIYAAAPSVKINRAVRAIGASLLERDGELIRADLPLAAKS